MTRVHELPSGEESDETSRDEAELKRIEGRPPIEKNDIAFEATAVVYQHLRKDILKAGLSSKKIYRERAYNALDFLSFPNKTTDEQKDKVIEDITQHYKPKR